MTESDDVAVADGLLDTLLLRVELPDLDSEVVGARVSVGVTTCEFVVDGVCVFDGEAEPVLLTEVDSVPEMDSEPLVGVTTCEWDQERDESMVGLGHEDETEGVGPERLLLDDHERERVAVIEREWLTENVGDDVAVLEGVSETDADVDNDDDSLCDRDGVGGMVLVRVAESEFVPEGLGDVDEETLTECDEDGESDTDGVSERDKL